MVTLSTNLYTDSFTNLVNTDSDTIILDTDSDTLYHLRSILILTRATIWDMISDLLYHFRRRSILALSTIRNIDSHSFCCIRLGFPTLSTIVDTGSNSTYCHRHWFSLTVKKNCFSLSLPLYSQVSWPMTYNCFGRWYGWVVRFVWMIPAFK